MSLPIERRAPARPAPTGSPAPIGGLTDPRFRYVRSEKTDISETFRRVRAEMAKGRLL